MASSEMHSEGELLRYTRANGWRRDEEASSATRAQLYALWLDDAGVQGWTVGRVTATYPAAASMGEARVVVQAVPQSAVDGLVR